VDAVLDTNVTVSAAINPKGPPAEIIRAWRAHRFTWVTSAPLLQELEKTLRSSRLQRYLVWNKEELADFLALVRQAARVVQPAHRLEVVTEDPADNRVLEAAVGGRADYIVTGDRHLIAIGSYMDVRIVTPARFVAVIATELA
jgi:putative PIN family toxin of toxin-antitoxin system